RTGNRAKAPVVVRLNYQGDGRIAHLNRLLDWIAVKLVVISDLPHMPLSQIDASTGCHRQRIQGDDTVAEGIVFRASRADVGRGVGGIDPSPSQGEIADGHLTKIAPVEAFVIIVVFNSGNHRSVFILNLLAFWEADDPSIQVERILC